MAHAVIVHRIIDSSTVVARNSSSLLRSSFNDDGEADAGSSLLRTLVYDDSLVVHVITAVVDVIQVVSLVDDSSLSDYST